LAGASVSSTHATATERAAIVTARIVRYPLIADAVSAASKVSATRTTWTTDASAIAGPANSAGSARTTWTTHATTTAGPTNSACSARTAGTTHATTIAANPAAITHATRVAIAEIAPTLLPADILPGVVLAIRQ
jgi:hypothetical protein